MLLLGKPVVEELTTTTQQYIQSHNLLMKRVVFFLLSGDIPSRVYVERKVDYAKKLWIKGEIVLGADWEYEMVLEQIATYNQDDEVLGIVVQLPLAPQLQHAKDLILNAILPHKDIDGLSATHVQAWQTPQQTILPATAQAVLALLDYYGYGNVVNLPVLVIGQSNLVGYPLTLALQQRGAIVATATSDTTRDHLCEILQQSTIIISATGQIGLLGEDFLPYLQEKHIIVDVGRGLVDGRPVGDTNWELLESHVGAITPVPGGVWPVTIACLFANMCQLHQWYLQLQQ